MVEGERAAGDRVTPRRLLDYRLEWRLPDMSEDVIVRPANTRGSRHCLNGWQYFDRAARSAIRYPPDVAALVAG
jgi:hypothetical protein